MKATIDIPDDLYRRVKVRCAMEGRTLRAVAVDVLQGWLTTGRIPAPGPRQGDESAPWLVVTRPYVSPGARHDMEDIRAAAAAGWASDSEADA